MSELTPYLAVRDARAAIEWYVDHLGAEVTYEPIVMPDDRIGHVELTRDGARWMMADEHPELQVEAPAEGRGAAVTLHLTVDDVDAHHARTAARGAEIAYPPTDMPYGVREYAARDSEGGLWSFMQPIEQPTEPEDEK